MWEEIVCIQSHASIKKTNKKENRSVGEKRRAKAQHTRGQV